jgi:3-dehydroquinate dehydratase/shikimate dehydrogenase
VNNGKICVSVCARTADEMIAKIKRSEEFAEVIEVRFDCLRPEQVGLIFDLIEGSQITTPLIAKIPLGTLSDKNKEQSNEQKELWQKIGKLFWIGDIETEGYLFAASTQRSIASFHDFDGSPRNLDGVFEKLSSTTADIIKIAVQTDDAPSAIPVWNVLKRPRPNGKDLIAIAMGEAGKWTRVLGSAHGSFLTYCSLDEGDETAPGQITAKDLTETYRVKDLDRNTKVYGVIGNPVSESLSPYIHNAAFAAQELNAVFVPFQVKDLDEFIRRMVNAETREIDLNFDGFSVTMPHKQAILKHLVAIDATAEKIGAVNTVKIEEERLIGYNTDAYGFITPLREHFGDLKNATAAVLGAGGAARACAFALKQENADVTIFAREKNRAETLAREFGTAAAELPTTEGLRPKSDLSRFDIIVNATPVGMKGPLENESLFTADQLEGVKFVYDLVTSAADTPMMREAKKAGVSAIGGIEMLIQQGAKQFEIWTGQRAPLEKMREAVQKRVSRT